MTVEHTKKPYQSSAVRERIIFDCKAIGFGVLVSSERSIYVQLTL